MYRKEGLTCRKIIHGSHQDSALVHSSLSIKIFLAEHRIPVLEHPYYWYNLALYDKPCCVASNNGKSVWCDERVKYIEDYEVSNLYDVK